MHMTIIFLLSRIKKKQTFLYVGLLSISEKERTS